VSGSELSLLGTVETFKFKIGAKNKSALDMGRVAELGHKGKELEMQPRAG
jgi:hypothetical protein